MPALPGYYTTKEAAEKLGYADSSALKKGCSAGTIPAFRVANVWLIPEGVVMELDKREVKPQGNRGVSRKE